MLRHTSFAGSSGSLKSLKRFDRFVCNTIKFNIAISLICRTGTRSRVLFAAAYCTVHINTLFIMWQCDMTGIPKSGYTSLSLSFVQKAVVPHF